MKEDLEDKDLITGACRFCGQLHQIVDFGPEADPDEAATVACNCVEAAQYTAKKRQRERATKSIEELFSQEEAVKEVLLHALDCIIQEEIVSATVDDGDRLKAKMTLTAKGNIKVERTEREKKVRES